MMYLACVGLPLSFTAYGATSKIIERHVARDGDNIVFKPSHLTCFTGTRVRLFFHQSDEIIGEPHDWLLLKPGALERFVADADKESDNATIPDKNIVMAATPVSARGHTVVVEFTAPRPGDYPLVCSVPGHSQSMRAVLTVTSN